MQIPSILLALAVSAAAAPGPTRLASTGPRPYFLIDDLQSGELKTKLESCADKSMFSSEFSIGHRGASMQFPEHTRESYIAAARMGAGIIECDVTYTKDKELVCRHAQNDLHTTTNILLTPLAAKCTKAFKPYDPVAKTPASAECRTTDITLAEFKTLKGKMDAANPKALTPQEYVAGTASWRTDLYSGSTSGTLMTHKESIILFKQLGVMMTPEAKESVVPMPFDGFTREDFVQKIVDEYKANGVEASSVFLQSFIRDDVNYLLKKNPDFGKQGVYLDSADTVKDIPTNEQLKQIKQSGINIWAPPIWVLLQNKNGTIAASEAALYAKSIGLDIITWSLERSGLMSGTDHGGWYYQTVNSAITREGDILNTVHVLAQQVGVRGIFSDWPATVTYYANCYGLVKGHC